MNGIGIYRIKTYGLYADTIGWLSSEKYEKWMHFWEHLKDRRKENGERVPVYIQYVPPKDNFGCGNIITHGGCMYLHAEGGTFVDPKIGTTPTDGVKEELEWLFKEVCDLCGATFKIAAKYIEVDTYDLLKKIYAEEEAEKDNG